MLHQPVRRYSRDPDSTLAAPTSPLHRMRAASLPLHMKRFSFYFRTREETPGARFLRRDNSNVLHANYVGSRSVAKAFKHARTRTFELPTADEHSSINTRPHPTMRARLTTKTSTRAMQHFVLFPFHRVHLIFIPASIHRRGRHEGTAFS